MPKRIKVIKQFTEHLKGEDRTFTAGRSGMVIRETKTKFDVRFRVHGVGCLDLRLSKKHVELID